MAFDLASDRMQPGVWRGQQIEPSFERFRKDVTILAGYCKATYKYDGSVVLEAESLRWSEMDELKFAELYQKTITVILEKILPGVDKDELENAVNMTMSYA